MKDLVIIDLINNILKDNLTTSQKINKIDPWIKLYKNNEE